MKNKLLLSSFRKIRSTKKKFLSLLCMALLGVGFFVGIKATGPDMLKTLNQYLYDNSVYDIEIVSTLGLTDDDIDELKKLNIASKVVGNKYTDEIINIKSSEKTVRIISLNDMNKVSFVEGRLPNSSKEIVVERQFLEDFSLDIGKTIDIHSDNLESSTYKIVGIVESPLYFTSYRGTTNVGNGEWNYYFYCLDDAFNMDYYTNIYLTLNDMQNRITNSDDYLVEVDNSIRKIEGIKKSREDARLDELYGENINTLKNQGVELEEKQFPKSIWYIFDRTDNQAYSTFIDSTQSIRQIGSVFPLIFFIVAILISLVSMSRMVEEERCEMGTLKGLGFSNYQLYFKNFLYAFLATSLGSVIGMFIGFRLIPNVIWNIYTALFFIPKFICEFNLYYAGLGFSIAVFCICGASVITTYHILKEKTSDLMRVKAPKVGKKIFLENFKFWGCFRFSTKISIRNIFRYKKRVIVTIIGLAGSTALMLVGFGLKDSVNDIVDFNYNNVFVYDRIIYLKDHGERSSLVELLDRNDQIRETVMASYELLPLYNCDRDSLEVNLIVPYDRKELNGVIQLHDVRKHYEAITLPTSGIILSEKLAKTLNVKVGDKVSFLVDNEYKDIVVKNITENYIRDYAYLSKEAYTNLFGDFKTNVIFLNVSDGYNTSFDNEIMSNGSVSNIVTKEVTSNLMNDVLSSLNSVVVILIAASAMLAFVILYNLSSINISERKREISTLKVLGFYDEEVDSYITNENYFITIIGVMIGLVGGLYLCHYVISTCEPQYLMFVRHIKWFSYVISSAISIIFTFIVSKITHYNLRKIDMVESLKSNE